MQPALAVGGYVLAGGLSSRMGREKALLILAGRPLIAHAVEKLGRFCADVSVLTNDDALAAFAPSVPDLHPGCGPMSGMEAALSHSRHDWNLVLPVDVPFLPTVLLVEWARATVAQGESDGTRIAMFEVDGVAQPALLMIHRDLCSSLRASLVRGEYKLGPSLQRAAAEIAAERELDPAVVLRRWGLSTESDRVPEPRVFPMTRAQRLHQRLWFANLNTAEDFANAELYTDVLDT